MAKVVIIDPTESTETPFLRGILTSSLLEAGLSFEDAYELASNIRQKLSNKTRITTHQMREMVVSELIKRDRMQVLERYTDIINVTPKLTVRDIDGSTQPFSPLKHRQSLESTGLATDEAILISQLLLTQLEELNRNQSTRLGV